jgi:NADH-quinone oxidoreductase subunit C
MSQAALDKLKAKFGDAVQETHSEHGDDTALVKASSWKAICEFLRKDGQLDFDYLVDLCAVDYPERAARNERLEVVLHLCSISKRHRLRLKARVGGEGDGEGDALEGAEIDSVTSIWPGANWFERETYDMFGLTFRGHPDMRRILMYPEFVGHPLLKDYPAQRTQPLIPYRTEEEAGVPLEKQAPFGDDEGMSFPRKDFDHDAEDPRTKLNPHKTEAV